MHAVRGAIIGILGNCLPDTPRAKPHGRVAYTLIHTGFVDEIGLSVILPRSKKSAE
jgi:hypothetical protein